MGRLTDRISAARALRGSRRAAFLAKDKARRLTQVARPRQLQMLVRRRPRSGACACTFEAGLNTLNPVANHAARWHPTLLSGGILDLYPPIAMRRREELGWISGGERRAIVPEREDVGVENPLVPDVPAGLATQADYVGGVSNGWP